MKSNYKKFISVFLVTAIFIMSLPVFAEEASDGAVVSESFDSYNSIGELSDNWFPDASTEIVKEEGRGNVLKMSLKSTDSSRIVKHVFDEPITKGVVKISYAFKPGENISTMFILRDSAGKQLVPAYIHSTGELVSGWSSITHPEFILRKERMFDVWHQVEAYFDIDNQKYKAVITDEKGGMYTMPWKSITTIRHGTPLVLSNFSELRMQMWFQGDVKSDGSSYFDDIKVEVMPARCLVNMVRTGGVYATEDEQKIDLMLENTIDESCDVTYRWNTEEREKGKLLEGEGKVSLNVGERQAVSVDISELPFGTYMLNLELEMNTSSNKSAVYKEHRSVPFSKIYSCDVGENSDFYGLATHMITFGTFVPEEDSLDLVRMSGAHSWRDPLGSWQTTERVAGVYDFKTPTIASGTIERQIDGVYQLGYGNPIHVKQVDANGNPAAYNALRAPTTNDEIAAFARYAASVAEQSNGAIKYFEVWNEWDGFMNVNKADGSAYVRVLKATYEALKKVDPDIIVIGIGGLGTSITSERFLREFCEAGGMYYCDAVSFHPYEKKGYFPNAEWFGRLDAMLKIMDQYGERPPLYLTEMGWQTAYNTPKGDNNPAVDEKTQAENMVKLAAVNKAYNYAELIHIHDLMENGYKHDFTEVEYSYGLVSGPHNPYGHSVAKPAYLSFTAVNKLMAGGVNAMGKIESNDYRTSIYCYERAKGDNLIVMYSDEYNKDISLKLDCQSVEVFDKYGNSLGIVNSKDGIFNFGLSDRMLFVVGKFGCFEQAPVQVSHAESVINGVKNDILTFTITDVNGSNYTSAIDYNQDEFTLIEKSDMVNGKMTIKLRVGENTKGTFPITVKLSDEDGLRYISSNYVKISPPVSVSIISQEAGNNNNWELAVSITNNAVNEKISGECTITSPIEFAEKMDTVNFADIPAGETRTVYMNIPEFIKKWNTTIKGEITLDYGHIEPFSQKLDFTSGYYANVKPTIDGVVDFGEWVGSCASAEKAADVVFTDGTRITDKTGGEETWRGADNLSINALKLMWDEDNFYLMAVVRDDIWVPTNDPANLWKNDSIQFGIENEFFNVPNRNQYPFTEIGISSYKGEAVAWRYSSMHNKPVGQLFNAECAVKRDGDTTVYEAKISWTELFQNDFVMDNSLIYAFTMLANDDDGAGRWAYCEYNTGMGRYKNAKEFGRLTLYK